ncbi:MAG TPA: glucose-1-phosphate adenylyltransferase, partial [Clostridiales bacterium]|nr:glucose-1-phosphate adenylyltransferase [Clostridiales bacterium]
ETGAACTVATITVPIEEASRFGICNTRADGTIYEFEEKPKVPKNNQASMGIYIFNTKTLIEYLEIDEADAKSSNDFGKNVIPNLLANGEKLYAYPFSGYWKDVGTIVSLWESNMDLIGEHPTLDLSDKDFRIFSRNTARPPQWIAKGAEISNAMISSGCRIYGKVQNSILSGGVTVEEGAEVYDSVIMSDVTVSRGAKVYTAIIDSDSTVAEGAVVGKEGNGKDNITVIAKGTTVHAGADRR